MYECYLALSLAETALFAAAELGLSEADPLLREASAFESAEVTSLSCTHTERVNYQIPLNHKKQQRLAYYILTVRSMLHNMYCSIT